MGVVKDFRYPVSAAWERDRLTRLTAPGRQELAVGAPPGMPGAETGWSPEELLVGAAATGYAVALAAVCERLEVPVVGLRVHGTGHVTLRDDDVLGFVAIELSAELDTRADHAAAAERAVELAESASIAGKALDVPVHVNATVRAGEAAAVGDR